MAGTQWKVGWRRNLNDWKSIEWGVPYEGTASGRELTLPEVIERVDSLARDNGTDWNDGRICVWRVPRDDFDESVPLRANQQPEIFEYFHTATTEREYSDCWHHPYPYLP